MADDPTTQNPTPPATPTPPTPPEKSGSDADPVKMAQELGELRKVKQDYEDYRKTVDPVIETIYSDTELLKSTQTSHRKRLGVKDDTPPAPDPNNPPKPPVDSDTRNATMNIIQGDFEKTRGIDKLDAKAKGEVRGQVGAIIKDMLDPNGNKSIAQVFEEVSLSKLPWYLDRAYDLLTRDKDIAAAKEQGKNEVLDQYDGDRGTIGSVEGGSVPIEQMTLSPKEREVAKKMGIAEDVYLKNKKALAQINS